jgi:hypothetical protein
MRADKSIEDTSNHVDSLLFSGFGRSLLQTPQELNQSTKGYHPLGIARQKVKTQHPRIDQDRT